MLRHADIFQARQRARFMRPDAARWIQPLHPDERKFDPEQPRDEQGRWTDGTIGAAAKNNDDSALVQDILARAQKLSFTASPADWRRCVTLCYPILERFSSRGSDIRYWDYQKCLNACLGLNR